MTDTIVSCSAGSCPPINRGQPAGSRWDGEKLIKYKGWTWSGGNQHGFMYQAQAIHRCMAAGLKGMP